MTSKVSGKKVTESYNEYARQYSTYVNEEGHKLIYGSTANPMTCTNVNEWVHHLIGEKEHQQQKQEPLLNSSDITKDDFIKALEIFVTNKKRKTPVKITSNRVGISGKNIPSTSGETKKRKD